MRYNHIPMVPYPEGAGLAVRTEMFFQYCEANQKANPALMLPLGIKRKWYQFFKSEHPFTSQVKRPEREELIKELEALAKPKQPLIKE